jgi:lipoprotein-anchoring transpeptidase ErfK/SrfK
MRGDHVLKRSGTSGCSATLFSTVSVLAVSGLLLTSTDALARKKPQPQETGLFGFFDAPPPPKNNYRVYGRRKPANPSAGTGDKADAKKAAQPQDNPIKGPLVITVSLGKQRLTVHDIDGPIAESPISSGTAAFPTLQGVFTILEKSVVHHSNLYDGAPMPNMQRITWSGTAMHAGHLPGYPASHGCIRLPYNFSKKLYGMTKLGTRVIVTRDPITPTAVKHANLIAPLPAENTAEAPKPVETKVADYETVRSLALITSAAAAEAVETGSVQSAPLTGYRAKRAAERQAAEDALKKAESDKIAAEAAAKDAVAAADLAKAEAKKAGMEAARLAQEVKKAEQARIDGDRALEAFGKRYVDASTLRADEFEKAAITEQQLEDKTFELGRNLEAAKEISAKAAAAAAEANAAVLAAVAKVKEQANALSKITEDMKKAAATIDSMKRQDLVRKHPVSVLISRSSGRLYVRQGYEPIFDVPVEIKDPQVAIGTHVFTAVEQTGPGDMRWTASSIPYTALPADIAKKKKKGPVDAQTVSTHLPQTPEAALDRVSIPDDARERIADVMKPGSSIVISDYGISHQTGKFTDFILLTR